MLTDRPRSTRGAGVIALLVTFLWSSSWVLIRWGLDDEALQPISFAALRYAMASVLLIGWVLFRPQLRSQLFRLERSQLSRATVLGVVFYALTQGAQFVAIDNQPVATTSLILALTPLLVALVAGRSLQERASGRQLVGTGLVTFGAWLYFAGDLGATIVGMAAALVGLGANTTSSLLGRHLNRPRDVSPIVITAYSMGVGASLLVLTGFLTEGIPVVSSRAWLIIGWLAVVNTALAFTLWNGSLRRLSALQSAGINNTMLVQIALAGWIFLDERPGPLELAGILLVSVGVLLIQVTSGRRSSAPPSGTGAEPDDQAEVRERRATP